VAAIGSGSFRLSSEKERKARGIHRGMGGGREVAVIAGG